MKKMQRAKKWSVGFSSAFANDRGFNDFFSGRLMSKSCSFRLPAR